MTASDNADADNSGRPTMPQVKRLVRLMTRTAIASLFFAIITTVISIIGVTGMGEAPDRLAAQTPPWLVVVSGLSGISWLLVLVLLVLLPVPLFMSMAAERRARQKPAAWPPASSE